MKQYQQSCTITLSTGARAVMTGIFEQLRPFVTPEMIVGGVKYHEIVWHKPVEIKTKNQKIKRSIR